MTITPSKNIFEELKWFKNIFQFLYDPQKLKSLGDNELKEYYVKFHSTFSHNNLSDVDVNDFFFKLRMLQFHFVK